MAEKKLKDHRAFELLLEGKATTTVRKILMEEYGVTYQGASRYIHAADKLMQEALKSKRVAKLNRAVAQREVLIEKLLEDGQLAMAAQLMGDSAKLQGLYVQDEGADTNVTIKVTQS